MNSYLKMGNTQKSERSYLFRAGSGCGDTSRIRKIQNLKAQRNTQTNSTRGNSVPLNTQNQVITERKNSPQMLQIGI